MAVSSHFLQPPAPPPSDYTWWPYFSLGDFSVHFPMILAAVMFSLTFLLAIHFCFVWWRRTRTALPPHHIPEPKPTATALDSWLPPMTMVYSSSGAVELAGASPAECVICLTEFADGDRIRVLPQCMHGFHAHCVQAWLGSHNSCPTCRRRCIP